VQRSGAVGLVIKSLVKRKTSFITINRQFTKNQLPRTTLTTSKETMFPVTLDGSSMLL
jgi:hypothetical protein